jgi:hypothetical protein
MSARSMSFLFLCLVLGTLGGCQNPGRFQASQKVESDDGPADVALGTAHIRAHARGTETSRGVDEV